VPRSVLVLYAHPAPRRSRANAALLAKARDVEGVTIRDLYALYPDMYVDAAAEREAILAHDALVFQHPLYWYSAPALVKEWLDVVLAHGFAYGEAGHALDGKTWMHAVTAGGGVHSYGLDGRNRFTIPELLRPFEATANLCRCLWLAPFAVHASHACTEETLAYYAAEYAERLRDIVDANDGAMA
jgi:glutathione-regulated potassium-efflux system ancillary protein KefG